ncbi:MAG: NfeD family protein [Litorimonas sp.]
MSDKDPTFIMTFLEGMNATRWMIFGIVLLGLELATGTTYILWTAAAAILMAGIVLVLPIGWGLQFVLFFVLSLALLILGHIYVRPRFKGGEPSDLNDRARSMVGQRVKAVSDFEVGKGRVHVGDTQWAAALETGTAKAGDELRILSVKGATLQVEIV